MNHPFRALTFDADDFGHMLLRLTLALLFALPVGWEREASSRSAGLRTFPLVAVAACSYVLIASRIIGTDAEAHARILEGLMTGIGFVGGGAILKDRHAVSGTATAASIWATGAIGAAVAHGELDLAILVSVATLVILRPLRAMRQRITHVPEKAELDEK